MSGTYSGIAFFKPYLQIKTRSDLGSRNLPNYSPHSFFQFIIRLETGWGRTKSFDNAAQLAESSSVRRGLVVSGAALPPFYETTLTVPNLNDDIL
jgi:hypothetical protein